MAQQQTKGPVVSQLQSFLCSGTRMMWVVSFILPEKLPSNNSTRRRRGPRCGPNTMAKKIKLLFLPGIKPPSLLIYPIAINILNELLGLPNSDHHDSKSMYINNPPVITQTATDLEVLPPVLPLQFTSLLLKLWRPLLQCIWNIQCLCFILHNYHSLAK